MFRLSRLFGLPKREITRRASGARRRRALCIEPLEERLLLSTTVFLDFGAAVGMGNFFDTTAAAYRDVFGANTGTDLTDNGLAAGDTLRLAPLSYDFDLNSIIDDNDLTALANAVLPLAQRALEPFDIDLLVGAATGLADAVTAVAANAGDATGEFDSYVFVMVATSDFGVGGGPFLPAVGGGLFGEAALTDLAGQVGNTVDEAALTFADNVFNSTTGVVGTAAFNANLAQRLAYTAIHEAFHTFSYVHTPDESGSMPPATANQRLLASGDVIRLGSVTREDPFMVTRYDLQHLGATVPEPNNYLLAANDADIGLRDDDANGTPDLAFVSGTGANDVIGLSDAGGGVVSVVVNPFSNQARTAAIGAGESYSVDLASDTDGTILVDAGVNADEVQLDATIAATFRLRGGEGADSSVSATADQDLLTLQSGGLSGTYTPGADDESGSVTYVGGAALTFSEFEDVEANGIPIVVNPLTLGSATLDEGDTLDLSGSFVNIDTLDTHQVVVSWGDGSADTVLDLVAGAREFAASHVYLDDNPSGTASDAYVISVTVTDEDDGAGTAGANVTVDNVDPVIQAFESNAILADKGEEGEPVTVMGDFTDVGVLDTHTAMIDWGDGTIEPVALVQGAGSGTIQGSHAYAAGGIYTVMLTVTDDDTGTHQASTLAVITGVGLNNGVLYAIGSAQDDTVHIHQTGRGTLKVHASFIDEPFREFEAAEVDQILSYLCQGDDRLTIAGNVMAPAIVHGDAGDDHLHGGGGPAVLLGGSGDDVLIGQSGRDLLVGGTGRDRLVGGGGDDVLIGGSTTFDHAQDAALASALALWTNPGASYEDRSTALDASLTVLDDAEPDTLTGASGDDLFYAGPGDAATGQKTAEIDAEPLSLAAVPADEEAAPSVDWTGSGWSNAAPQAAAHAAAPWAPEFLLLAPQTKPGRGPKGS